MTDLPLEPPARTTRLAYVVLLLVIAAVAVAIWMLTRPGPVVIQGEVAAPRVDVSARISGRVAEIGADTGDTATRGQLLVRLENPQLLTAFGQAEAALAAADSNAAAVAVIRPENVRAAEAQLAAAQADLDLARETQARNTALESRGVRSQAAVEQGTRNLEAADRQVDAAAAQLDLVRAGATPEQRAAADAQAEQARAALAQQQANLDDLQVFAPMDGQITGRMVEIGENIGPGAPLFTIVQPADAWFSFNIREDLLNGVAVGDTLTVRLPALDRDVSATVTMLNVQGDFASWRATRATGDFDLRSFELRARPDAPVEGLRPGMSALLPDGL